MLHRRTVSVLVLVFAALALLALALRHYQRVITTRVTVVVARYREDVAWMASPHWRQVVHRFYLYCKGPELTDAEHAALPDNVVVCRLPNVGRCDHTYVHHIVEHYGAKGVTVFVSGDANNPRKGPKIHRVIWLAALTGTTVFSGGPIEGDSPAFGDNFHLNAYLSQNDCNRRDEGADTSLRAATPRPYGTWFRDRFPGEPFPTLVCWMSIFAVHRRHITQHPVARYQGLRDELADHPNPEAGHFVERSWVTIFGPVPKECLYDDNAEIESLDVKKYQNNW